jgi:hypothetical protein
MSQSYKERRNRPYLPTLTSFRHAWILLLRLELACVLGLVTVSSDEVDIANADLATAWLQFTIRSFKNTTTEWSGGRGGLEK